MLFCINWDELFQLNVIENDVIQSNEFFFLECCFLLFYFYLMSLIFWQFLAQNNLKKSIFFKIFQLLGLNWVGTSIKKTYFFGPIFNQIFVKKFNILIQSWPPRIGLWAFKKPKSLAFLPFYDKKLHKQFSIILIGLVC